MSAILAGSLGNQVVSSSHDTTIRAWDIRVGRTVRTVNIHSRGVRGLVSGPRDMTFYSSSTGLLKKFSLPETFFLLNTSHYQSCIVDALSCNNQGVLASGGNDGSIWFWDYCSGRCIQQQHTLVVPCSVYYHVGVNACQFDMSGTLLLTAETDKTVKIWSG